MIEKYRCAVSMLFIEDNIVLYKIDSIAHILHCTR